MLDTIDSNQLKCPWNLKRKLKKNETFFQPTVLPRYSWVPSKNFSPFGPAFQPAISNIYKYLFESEINKSCTPNMFNSNKLSTQYES